MNARDRRADQRARDRFAPSSLLLRPGIPAIALGGRPVMEVVSRYWQGVTVKAPRDQASQDQFLDLLDLQREVGAAVRFASRWHLELSNPRRPGEDVSDTRRPRSPIPMQSRACGAQA